MVWFLLIREIKFRLFYFYYNSAFTLTGATILKYCTAAAVGTTMTYSVLLDTANEALQETPDTLPFAIDGADRFVTLNGTVKFVPVPPALKYVSE